MLIPWYKNHGLNHSQQLLKLFASGGDYSGSSAAAARERATREELKELKKQAQLNDRLSLLTVDSQKAGPPQKRYDFMLQENGMETYVKSLGVLSAHTNYFNTTDVSYFILMKIHDQQV